MGIQQKLHTKLVQKLILTPSLQQAIKLLPMSTLELSDLLNQEMVENPMLEEVPTEELQPIENTLSTSTSLSDHLLWQLSMQTDDALMREIGSALVGNLDDDGYLVASFDELGAMGPWPVA